MANPTPSNREPLLSGPAQQADAAAWGPEDETVSAPQTPASGPPPIAPRPVTAHRKLDGSQPGPRKAGETAQTSHRDDLLIPDYQLLKRIGSGAYGEVWLAQSVTGALRAVKIVWREDFELTRTFHREFEGIQQFEPISRGHPCLVHILHVGWNEERGYYYCVMELADDAVNGGQINDLAAYTPRTISSDMKANGRLDLHFCREAGVYLADALAYMHDHGLAHRDIKPSNIIFVGGMCKLADIGLVAASGERTFVGTEGFVPPEGPGTHQADIYSLGKVLYEMSSGNDRMEFPEVPRDLRENEWDFWLDLNRVICKACAPDLKERFSKASDMMHALQQVGHKPPEKWWRRFARAAVLVFLASMLAGAGIVLGRQQADWTVAMPAPVRPARVDRPEPEPPVAGRPWRSRFGRWFTFQNDRHVADTPLEYELYTRYLDATLMPFEGEVAPFKAPGDRMINIVLIQPQDADAFCAWITGSERGSRHLDPFHEYAWTPAELKGARPGTAGLTAVRPQVVRIPVGRLILSSTPSGAAVFEGDIRLGQTPLELPERRAGGFTFTLRRPGFASQDVNGTIEEGKTTSLEARLRPNGAVVFGKDWKNSLGMQFVPLNRALLAATETRWSDYAEYARSTGASLPPDSGNTEADLPVTNVTRLEAQLFCRWLTGRERALGLLEEGVEYRLPTDDEWSMAAYLPRERGATPEERNLRIGGIYPWGFRWPPPRDLGNFADGDKGIPAHEDGHSGPAPVGAFKKDSRGLFDLAGNVWEWVEDSWSEEDEDLGVARGGSYLTAERQELLASFRLALPPDSRRPDVGFRVLLIPVGEQARDDDP
jgi:formylglycine-generating enzyme required for sulfatase activity